MDEDLHRYHVRTANINNVANAPPAHAYSIPKTNTKSLKNGKSSSEEGVWVQWAIYILIVLVVLTIIVIFVHYMIMPVFQLTPGCSGIITIPGFQDGELLWNTGMIGEI